MTKRLIDFYSISREWSFNGASSYLWRELVSTHHGPLSKALSAGDERLTESVLRDPRTLWGIEHYEAFRWNEPRTIRHLCNLAARVGILPVNNPEQPSPTNNSNPTSIEKLRVDVEGVVGKLSVPQGFVFQDSADGIPYTQFFRMAEWFTISKFLGRNPISVMEIGAGVGGFALESFKHGVKKYTIIDLPTTCVISAFFMSKILSPDQIWLFGESGCQDCRFRWIPDYKAVEAKSEYDLIVNGNSFPEIEPRDQDRYIDYIFKWLSPGGIFYSANHESDMLGQRSVSLAVRHSKKLECVYRAPYMMRDGYVEEIYMKP